MTTPAASKNSPTKSSGAKNPSAKSSNTQKPSPLVSPTTEQRYAALRDYVQKTKPGGRWLVLTHDNPDPDALAAAMLLSQVLGSALKQKVTTAYSGIIGRAENREMVRSLGWKFSHLRHLNLKKYRHFALVDTQPRTGNNSLPEEIVPTLVIDHHPLRKATTQVPLVDIRTEYGATATIATEYLLAGGLEPTRAGATGLVYAIRSETQDFARESPGPDKAIYDDVLPRANKRLLGRIQAAPLSKAYFRILHEALKNLVIVDTLVISHLGEVEQPDIVPEIADLLLRMETKTWSLCTGIFDQRIYLSIRTTNPRAQAGRLMRRLIGRRGKGGGHSMIAGGWMVPNSSDFPTAQNALGQRFAKLLRKKPEKMTPFLVDL